MAKPGFTSQELRSHVRPLQPQQSPLSRESATAMQNPRRMQKAQAPTGNAGGLETAPALMETALNSHLKNAMGRKETNITLFLHYSCTKADLTTSREHRSLLSLH